MNKEYEHVALVNFSPNHIVAGNMRKKTLVFWIGKPTKMKYVETLTNLLLIEEAELQNNVLLSVKFVAIDLQFLKPDELISYRNNFLAYDAGILDTKGLSQKKFLQQYNTSIEAKIQRLILLESKPDNGITATRPSRTENR